VSSEIKTDKVTVADGELRPNEVRNDGIPLPNGPHNKLNFTGADVIAADAGDNEATVFISGAGGGVEDYGLNLPPVSGSWFGPCAISQGQGLLSLFNQRAYFIPVVVPVATTFDRIGFSLEDDDSGGATHELAVYDSVGGLPANRLSLNQFINPSFGVNSYALAGNLALNPGLYWLTIWCGGTPFQLEAVLHTNANFSNVYVFNTGTFAQSSIAYLKTLVGGLPATVTGPFTGIQQAPFVLLRGL
jgi:hypothetical protein